MTERRKDLLVLTLLLAVLIIFFGRILFTDKIIRAPDIINEFYWGVDGIRNGNLWDVLRIRLTPSWNLFINSGVTDEGGGVANSFHFYRAVLFFLIPAPASVAWFIVLHLFFGAAGVYYCCRLIGVSRPAAFFGGLIFALAPENASLINAGHVIKIATICFVPWAFFSLEKAFQSRRLIWFMSTSIILAFQFFGGHWQIAFYTCLCVGVYGIVRLVAIYMSDRKLGESSAKRLLAYNLVLLLFFLSTVSISLIPLANWSKDTNRGVQSGANQGKGGLDREEAMSWSMPPEETAAFVIPGIFGFSRQEAGPNPSNIRSYYWGRMVFTQTLSYMGLLPWLLVPLPLIFRRDRYAWLAVIGIVGGILFSMGKYTPFYNFLFDYFPGINRFRVPKMMMFIPVMGLAMLAARGLDLALDGETRKTKTFRRYLIGVATVPVALLVLLGVLQVGRDTWIRNFIDVLIQPTRYEQGEYLVMQRWNNLMIETGITSALASLCAATLWLFGQRGRTIKWLPFILLALYVGDVWRINDKFMFLVPVPETSRGVKSPTADFLAKGGNQYRVLPMNGADPMYFVSNKIPVMFTSNPVQQRRWQEFLDAFTVASAMPDIMNVRYMVVSAADYAQQKSQLGDKYVPVFQSPDGGEVVLENRTVLPKAWLVPSVAVVDQPQQALGVLQNPSFNPRSLALVESSPPIPLAMPGQSIPVSPGGVTVNRYEGEQIDLTATTAVNSLLVLGEKYYRGWKARVDGKDADIYPVDHVLRGVYLTPGKHTVELVFDPLPFKIGKYLTLASFALFAAMFVREWFLRRREQGPVREG